MRFKVVGWLLRHVTVREVPSFSILKFKKAFRELKKNELAFLSRSDRTYVLVVFLGRVE